VTGNRVLWGLDAQSVNALFGAASAPTRFVTPVQAPDRAQWLQATSDRS